MTSLRHSHFVGTIVNFARVTGRMAADVVFRALRPRNEYPLSMPLLPPVESGLDASTLGPTEHRSGDMSINKPCTLQWPGVESMLGGDFELTWSRRAKYQMRLLRTVGVRQRLLEDCALTRFGRALLGTRPRALYPVMNHLLDRRLGAEERLIATVASIRTVCNYLAEPQRQALLVQELTLATLADGTRLTFGLNGVSFHEGLWQVGLITASGIRLYSIGFGFKDTRALLIANVQGPSLGVDGPALIRQSTHSAHGMRPPHLLLHALRLLAAQWRVEVLLGVDPKNHVKGRWNIRSSRLRFDYRAFWIEGGAIRHEGGNWSLPLAIESRPLADVPSKRRAMYRRRYEMLTQLENAVAALSRQVIVVGCAGEVAGIARDLERTGADSAEACPNDPLTSHSRLTRQAESISRH